MCDKKLPFEIFLWGLKPNHETIVASLHGGNKFLQSCPCSVHASVWRLILNLESHGWRFPIPSWLLCFDWGNNLGLPLGWLCFNFGSPLPWPPTRPLFNLVSLGSLGNPSLPCRRLFLGGIVHGFCLELLLLLVEFLGNFSSFFLPFWGIKGCVCVCVSTCCQPHFKQWCVFIYIYIYRFVEQCSHVPCTPAMQSEHTVLLLRSPKGTLGNRKWAIFRKIPRPGICLGQKKVWELYRIRDQRPTRFFGGLCILSYVCCSWTLKHNWSCTNCGMRKKQLQHCLPKVSRWRRTIKTQLGSQGPGWVFGWLCHLSYEFEYRSTNREKACEVRNILQF